MYTPDTEHSKRVARAWLQVQRPVYAYITTMASNYADADDVMQSVAMTMVDQFDQYDNSRPLLNWVLGIARNKMLEHVRRRSRDRHMFDTDVLTALESAYQQVSADDEAIRQALAECMRGLTDRHRQVLGFRYESDLKPAAIAERMNLTSAVISNLLQRARASLRRCMQHRLSHIRLEIDG